MRSRHMIAAMSAAAGLAITLPLSAAAATGTFTQLYVAPARSAFGGTTNNTDLAALVFDDTKNRRFGSAPGETARDGTAPDRTAPDGTARLVLFAC